MKLMIILKIEREAIKPKVEWREHIFSLYLLSPTLLSLRFWYSNFREMFYSVCILLPMLHPPYLFHVVHITEIDAKKSNAFTKLEIQVGDFLCHKTTSSFLSNIIPSFILFSYLLMVSEPSSKKDTHNSLRTTHVSFLSITPGMYVLIL